MFILYADKNKLAVRQREPTTSGSVNVYTARFEFSPDWQGLKRRAVFKAGRASRAVLLDENGECAIPWEVLTAPGQPLMAGVFGTQVGTALPTTWAMLGVILEGAPGDSPGSRPPTPDAWEYELSQKGDTLACAGGELGLYAGDRLLSSVRLEAGYGVGHGLKVVNGELTVEAANDFKGDNTLPMTAAGVQTVVGSIETLLETI